MAFPAAPTESGGAKLHFLTNDPNAALGWFGVTEGVTGTGANAVGFAGIATHVEGDVLDAPGGLATTATDVPLVLVGGDSGTTVRALQVDGSDFLKVILQANPTVAIGKLGAADGVDIGNVDVASIVPGTGATNLGKQEDAQHTSLDVGVMVLAVRTDTPAALAGTTGDYIPLSTNSTGALYVTGGGGGTEYVVNDIAPANPTGATFVMERDDALAALAEVEGDWTNPRATAEGALWTQDFNSDAMLTALQGATPAGDNNIGNVDLVTGPTGGSALQNQGASASGAAKAGNPTQIGGVFNTTQPTVTTGQTVEAQSTARGAQIVATGVDAFTVAQGGSPWGVNPVGETAGVGVGAAADAIVVAGAAGSLSAKLRRATQGLEELKTTIVLAAGGNNIGVVDTELPTAAALSDAIANPIAPMVGAALMGFDGTDWERLRFAIDDPGAMDRGLVVRIAGGLKDTGWDATAIPPQIGAAINVTTAETALLASAAGDRHNITDIEVSYYSGSTAPVAKRHLEIYHGTGGSKRLVHKFIIPAAAAVLENVAIQFRVPDRADAVTLAVNGILDGALGTDGAALVTIHSYKTTG